VAPPLYVHSAPAGDAKPTPTAIVAAAIPKPAATLSCFTCVILSRRGAGQIGGRVIKH
jgi:hypothetical protein